MPTEELVRRTQVAHAFGETAVRDPGTRESFTKKIDKSYLERAEDEDGDDRRHDITMALLEVQGSEGMVEADTYTGDHFNESELKESAHGDLQYYGA